jgi:hypothetical protein
MTTSKTPASTLNRLDQIKSCDSYTVIYEFLCANQTWSITSLHQYCKAQFSELPKPSGINFTTIFKIAITQCVSEL